jgi:hypothetical protein
VHNTFTRNVTVTSWCQGNKQDVWYRVYFKSGRGTRKRLTERKEKNGQTKIDQDEEEEDEDRPHTQNEHIYMT